MHVSIDHDDDSAVVRERIPTRGVTTRGGTCQGNACLPESLASRPGRLFYPSLFFFFPSSPLLPFFFRSKPPSIQLFLSLIAAVATTSTRQLLSFKSTMKSP